MTSATSLEGGPRAAVRPRDMATRDDIPDATVVADLTNGDHDALAELYRRYGGAVWSVAKRVCGDRTLAEDVTQTVFVDLWRRPQRYDPSRGALRPWLMAQAHARAVDGGPVGRGPPGGGQAACGGA
jgi:hypothetical protein